MDAILKVDYDVIDRELANRFNTKGVMAEQFAAQHLAYVGWGQGPPRLFYWLREKGSQKGEIDFLVERGSGIIPIEVKSSGAGHLKSVFYFSKEKKSERTAEGADL